MRKERCYEVVRPETHEGWNEERKKHIGASDAAKVLGLSKYETPYLFWRKKVGLDEPTKENWSMRAGHVWEQFVADEFERQKGYKIIKSSEGDWVAVSRAHPFLGVSPDRTFWYGPKKNEESKALLECKSSRMPYKPEDLFDPKTCLSWFIQVQLQLHVTGMKHAFLGFICTDNGDMWFDHIEYDEDFCKYSLIPKLEAFWKDCVVPARSILSTRGNKFTPETIEMMHDFAPKIEYVEDVKARFTKHVEGKSIVLDFDGLDEYIERKAKIKELTDENDKFADICKLKMMDAESIVDADGNVVITWKANKNGVRQLKVIK